MSDVLNRVRRICVFALPARDRLQSGVSRRGGVRRSAVSSAVSRSVVTALVVGAVWGCGNEGGDTSSGPGASLGPGASSGVAPNDTAQGNVAPVAPGSNGTGSTDTGANGTGSNSTGSNNIAPNGTGANGSTDTGSNSEPNSSSPTGATGGVAPVTPAGSTGDDGVTGPPNDVSPMPSNTAGTEPGGGDQTTTPTSDTDTVGSTGEQTDSTEVDTTNDTTDAQTTDEPTEPSPGSADCGSLLLCDDFEGASAGGYPDASIWSMVTGYNFGVTESEAVRITADQAYRGTQSLRVDANGLAGVVASVAAERFHLRAFMQLDAAPGGPVLTGIGTDQHSEVRFRIFGNSWPTINFSPGDDVFPQAARENNCASCPVLNPGQWFCMEFFVDNINEDATLWIDGAEAAVAEVIVREDGTSSWPSFTSPIQVRLGSMDLQNGSTGLWIDEVAIGAERIGCE